MVGCLNTSDSTSQPNHISSSLGIEFLKRKTNVYPHPKFIGPALVGGVVFCLSVCFCCYFLGFLFCFLLLYSVAIVLIVFAMCNLVSGVKFGDLDKSPLLNKYFYKKIQIFPLRQKNVDFDDGCLGLATLFYFGPP